MTHSVLFGETANVGYEGGNKENVARHHVRLLLQLLHRAAPPHLNTDLELFRNKVSFGTFSLASPPTNLLARLIVAPVASASC